MNDLWIVKFVRKDGKPDEEYYYHSLAKAEYHRDLFLNDDSGLYEKIEIINENSKEVTMELNFIKCGDYYIPDIKLKNPNIRLGKWFKFSTENAMQIGRDTETKQFIGDFFFFRRILLDQIQ